MGLLLCVDIREDRTMNVRPFEFKEPPPLKKDEDRPDMRAAPKQKDDEEDQRGEEPADEPGYGHGV